MEFAKRKVAFTNKHTHSPNPKQSIDGLHDLPAGEPVLVWREKSKKWEGPFKFIIIDGETVFIQQPHGRKIFRSTFV